jgi:hypothetical protein
VRPRGPWRGIVLFGVTFGGGRAWSPGSALIGLAAVPEKTFDLKKELAAINCPHFSVYEVACHGVLHVDTVVDST